MPKVKMNFLIFTCLILTLGLGGMLYIQNQKLESLSQKVTKLEYNQALAEPENAWVAEAATNLFTFAFNDYKSVIVRNKERYLSKTGEEAYDQLLTRLNLIEKITTTSSVSLTRTKGLPTQETIIQTAPLHDERIGGGLAEYKIPVGISLQSGASKQPEIPLTLIFTVGKQSMGWEYPHPDFRWIITKIKFNGGESL